MVRYWVCNLRCYLKKKKPKVIQFKSEYQEGGEVESSTKKNVVKRGIKIKKKKGRKFKSKNQLENIYHRCHPCSPMRVVQRTKIREHGDFLGWG